MKKNTQSIFLATLLCVSSTTMLNGWFGQSIWEWISLKEERVKYAQLQRDKTRLQGHHQIVHIEQQEQNARRRQNNSSILNTSIILLSSTAHYAIRRYAMRHGRFPPKRVYLVQAMAHFLPLIMLSYYAHRFACGLPYSKATLNHLSNQANTLLNQHQ